jgi:hypothetical protein
MGPYIDLFQGLPSAIGVISAAVVGAIFARRSYVKQKEIDREEDLRKRRAEEYESYIKTFRKVMKNLEDLQKQARNAEDTEWFLGEARAEYDELYTFLVVIASDEVCLRAAALHDYLSKRYNRESKDIYEMRDEEIRNLYSELITAMRRDCFEETSLSPLQINPWPN